MAALRLHVLRENKDEVVFRSRVRKRPRESTSKPAWLVRRLGRKLAWETPGQAPKCLIAEPPQARSVPQIQGSAL